MVEIINKIQTERIESIGNVTDIFGVKSCKSYRSYLQNRIIYFRNKNLKEIEMVLEGLLSAYNKFHPKQETQIEVERWKGKSSFELIKGIDRLTIIKFQKKDMDSEPKEVRTEVTREELISLIDTLNFLQKRTTDRDFLTTREIAFQYCLNMNIKETDKGINLFEGDFWNNFFSWRSAHNKLTLMLDSLRELRLIEYSAGKIKILKNIEIQMIL